MKNSNTANNNVKPFESRPQPPELAINTRFPSPIAIEAPDMPNEKKIELIASHMHEILKVLGLDLNDESIARTPYRIAKMYVEEIFSGLDTTQFPEMSFIKDHTKDPHTVFVKVSFTSFCEHHFVPMNGTAYVSYKPNGKLIGLSKIPRIVRFFAKRPQVQERLTAQIADSLSILLETEDVAVSMSAVHYCVIARGIEDGSSHTITNVLRGEFRYNESLRKEFFENINRK